jgi:hypothetical protein
VESFAADCRPRAAGGTADGRPGEPRSCASGPGSCPSERRATSTRPHGRQTHVSFKCTDRPFPADGCRSCECGPAASPSSAAGSAASTVPAAATGHAAATGSAAAGRAAATGFAAAATSHVRHARGSAVRRRSRIAATARDRRGAVRTACGRPRRNAPSAFSTTQRREFHTASTDAAPACGTNKAGTAIAAPSHQRSPPTSPDSAKRRLQTRTRETQRRETRSEQQLRTH